MYLQISVVVAILCTQLSVDGYSKSGRSGINGISQSRLGFKHVSQGKSPRLKVTELSAILPTVYSAIAVASVIAFHEAGMV